IPTPNKLHTLAPVLYLKNSTAKYNSIAINVKAKLLVNPPVTPPPSTHLAYRVISSVIVVNVYSFVNPLSLYQATKTYPDLVGSSGGVTLAPKSKVISATALPPLLSKLIVY